MSGGSEVAVRTSESSRLRVVPRIREIVAKREVLLNLVRRELKVKYAASLLGAVWSLLNPLATMVIFTVVFRFFLKVQIEPGADKLHVPLLISSYACTSYRGS